MPYGVLPEGFLIKTVDDILLDMSTKLRARISPNIRTSSDSTTGQFLGVFAEQLGEAWEMGQAAYSSLNPVTAENSQLENISAITDTIRRDATYSTVTLTLNLDNGTVIPALSVVSEVGNANSKWVNPVAFTATLPGTQNYEVEFRAENRGPVVANSGTLTVIETPIVGWNSVTNVSDAIRGLSIETDSELRIRRIKELNLIGKTSLPSIQAFLENLDGVLSVNVLENTQDFVDARGLPPHSIEAIVYQGDDQEIGNALLDVVAGGIQTFGNTDVIVSHNGEDLIRSFTRPEETEVWLEFTIGVDEDLFPEDGADLIVQAIVNFASNRFFPGDDIILSQFNCPIFEVNGVVDVEEAQAGFDEIFVFPANLEIDLREIGLISSERVEVIINYV